MVLPVSPDSPAFNPASLTYILPSVAPPAPPDPGAANTALIPVAKSSPVPAVIAIARIPPAPPPPPESNVPDYVATAVT